MDGEIEKLLRGDGVTLESPGDDNKGIGGISANIPKKHSQNQKQLGRYIRFNEIKAIKDIDNNIIWESAV